MKKLNKLSINPDKVIKNDELTNLRGGYGTTNIFQCCCGMGQTYDCFTVATDGTCSDAAAKIAEYCSYGGGCFC